MKGHKGAKKGIKGNKIQFSDKQTDRQTSACVELRFVAKNLRAQE